MDANGINVTLTRISTYVCVYKLSMRTIVMDDNGINVTLTLYIELCSLLWTDTKIHPHVGNRAPESFLPDILRIYYIHFQLKPRPSNKFAKKTEKCLGQSSQKRFPLFCKFVAWF